MPWMAFSEFAPRTRAAAVLATCLLACGCDQLSSVAGGIAAKKNAQDASPEGAGSGKFAKLSVPARQHRTGERIRIATFNIQVLGTSKIGKPDVVKVLADVVRRFDVVAIQELRTTDSSVLAKLAAAVNEDGSQYRYLAGPRLGRTSSKEQYVFMYDSRRIALEAESVHTSQDPNDHLHREPLLARFRSLLAPPEKAFTFTLINIHTDPDEVKTEMDVMDDVFYSALSNGYEDDVLVLGDFNASYDGLGQLGSLPDIVTVLHGELTNTRGTKSYDNIVMHGQHTTEYLSVFGIVDLKKDYGLTDDEALAVSDHLPVWAEFSAIEHAPNSNLASEPAAPRR